MDFGFCIDAIFLLNFSKVASLKPLNPSALITAPSLSKPEPKAKIQTFYSNKCFWVESRKDPLTAVLEVIGAPAVPTILCWDLFQLLDKTAAQKVSANHHQASKTEEEENGVIVCSTARKDTVITRPPMSGDRSPKSGTVDQNTIFISY